MFLNFIVFHEISMNDHGISLFGHCNMTVFSIDSHCLVTDWSLIGHLLVTDLLLNS